MVEKKPELEEIAGYAGVGSLEILGIFFILDGLSGFLSFIETYSDTKTWSILVTMPLLVVAYIFGLLSSLVVATLSNRFIPSCIQPDLIARILVSKVQPLVSRMAEVERCQRVLHGATLGFVLLATGALVETRMMGQFAFVGYIGCLGGLLVSASCLTVAVKIRTEFLSIALKSLELASEITERDLLVSKSNDNE